MNTDGTKEKVSLNTNVSKDYCLGSPEEAESMSAL